MGAFLASGILQPALRPAPPEFACSRPPERLWGTVWLLNRMMTASKPGMGSVVRNEWLGPAIYQGGGSRKLRDETPKQAAGVAEADERADEEAVGEAPQKLIQRKVPVARQEVRLAMSL